MYSQRNCQNIARNSSFDEIENEQNALQLKLQSEKKMIAKLEREVAEVQEMCVKEKMAKECNELTAKQNDLENVKARHQITEQIYKKNKDFVEEMVERIKKTKSSLEDKNKQKENEFNMLLESCKDLAKEYIMDENYLSNEDLEKKNYLIDEAINHIKERLQALKHNKSQAMKMKDFENIKLTFMMSEKEKNFLKSELHS